MISKLHILDDKIFLCHHDKPVISLGNRAHKSVHTKQGGKKTKKYRSKNYRKHVLRCLHLYLLQIVNVPARRRCGKYLLAEIVTHVFKHANWGIHGRETC